MTKEEAIKILKEKTEGDHVARMALASITFNRPFKMKYITLWDQGHGIELGSGELERGAWDYLYGAFEDLDSFTIPSSFSGLIDVDLITDETTFYDRDEVLETLEKMKEGEL